MDQNSPVVTSPSLPPISELFAQSWDLFKKCILKLFIFNIIGISIYALLGGVGGVATFLLIGLNAGNLQGEFTEILSALNPAVFGTAAILGIVFFLAFMLLSLILQIGLILIVDKEGNIRFQDIFKKSLLLMLPFFLTNLLSGFLILGGFFLLFIPALFISTFFAFVPYEVVLGNSRYLDALRKSVLIVTKNFWPIFLRIIVIGIIPMIISFSISSFGSQDNPSTSFLVSILSTIINSVFGMFVLCYNLILYRQARVGLENKQEGKLIWIVVVSAVGWILAILLGVALVQIMPTLLNSFNTPPQPTIENPYMQDLMESTPPIESSSTINTESDSYSN